VLFGGRSAEHEVSIQSARNVVEAMDLEKYQVTLIGIDRQGSWRLDSEAQALLADPGASLPALEGGGPGEERVALVPGQGQARLISCSTSESLGELDVVFPVLHGPYGEDGTVQGLLKLADVPFVGAGITGSAVGMDKDVMKRLMSQAGIPNARCWVVSSSRRPSFGEIASDLGLPVFVKPANLGSSVGISRVTDEASFAAAVDSAFSFDRKVIVEEAIPGREIECSVLGNQEPIASVPGEIIPNDEFYSYQAKYIDENGAVLCIPAELDERTVLQVQDLAVRTFQVLCCEGMARVDMFLRPDGRVFVNEINTIPGFTRISMYPKLWEVSGIPPGELIDRLIELALERSGQERKLRSTRED
jgi:D-alanine-D-alanine ligase